MRPDTLPDASRVHVTPLQPFARPPERWPRLQAGIVASVQWAPFDYAFVCRNHSPAASGQIGGETVAGAAPKPALFELNGRMTFVPTGRTICDWRPPGAVPRGSSLPVDPPVARAGHARGGLSGWRRKRVTDYIEEHLGEEVRLATLAALVDLSPYHFVRAFRQSFGAPPHRYHIGRRIARAKALLAEPANSVTGIARRLGFAETSSFSATFRRTTGCSPSQYRRRLG